MQVSQNVQQLERDISHYDRNINQEKEKIRILKAEWAYLNNPTRLEALATSGYNLQTPNIDALISDPARFLNVFSPASSLSSSSGTSSQKDITLHPQTLSSKKQGGRD